MNQSKRFSVLRINAVVAAIAILALASFGAISDAQAKITAFFSAGATCEGASSANFVAAGVDNPPDTCAQQAFRAAIRSTAVSGSRAQAYQCAPRGAITPSVGDDADA